MKKAFTNSPLNIKWQPEHFPQGTLVRVKFPSGIERNNDIYEVESVYRNSHSNYVIKTTTPLAIEGLNETFAVGYVVEVIKRGSGPMIIQSVKDPYQWRKNYLQDLRLLWRYKLRFGELVDIHTKTHYNFSTGHDIIYFLMEKLDLFNKPSTIDLSEMAAALQRQSFVHFHRDVVSQFYFRRGNGSVIAISAPKKRVNRWFKQNYNRFLISNKTADANMRKAMDY